MNTALENIKLSFIIPVYNAEAYLKRCLDSLLNQDIKEFEIITVNDGSSDKSEQILNEYAQKYPTIVRVLSQSNQGQGPARNNGFKIARGKYIWLIDNDDYIRPNCLGSIVKILDKSNPEIFCFDTISLKENHDLVNWKETINLDVLTYKTKDAILLERAAPWNKIYLRTFIENISLNYPECTSDDVPESYRIFACSNNILKSNEPFIVHILRKSSDSHTVTKRRITTFLDAIRLLLQHAQTFPEYSQEMEYVAYRNISCMKALLKSIWNPKDEIRTALNESLPEYDKIESDLLSRNNVYIILENQNADIYRNSISWRITKPFRTLISIVYQYLSRISAKKH